MSDLKEGASASTGGDSTPKLAHLEEASLVLPQGHRVGRYIVLRELGSGGMGVVYEAIDPELDRRVALKFIKQGAGLDLVARARMVREAQAMAKVSHPNVVPVFDVGIDEGRFFIAMEYVKGRTMAEWLSQGPRAWREVVQAMVAAGEGLWAAHQVGLIHRDFKPENVLIGDDGRALVMDFGVARGQEPAPSGTPDGTVPLSLSQASLGTGRSAFEADVTAAGQVMGTLAYLAPEQFHGVAAGPLTDQFAFGVALFKGLFKVRPYEVDLKVLRGRGPWKLRLPATWTRVPAPLRKTVLKAISLDPSQRYASMEALVRELRRDPFALIKRVVLGVGLTCLFGLVGGGVVVPLDKFPAPARVYSAAWQIRPDQPSNQAINGAGWPL